MENHVHLTDKEILDTLRNPHIVLSTQFLNDVADRYEKLMNDRDLLANKILSLYKEDK